MSKIAIRIDDLCENMDWSSFNRFADILDKYNIKPLVGVIPDNKDTSLNGETKNDFASWLRQRVADGWVVATHGYTHVYTTNKGGIFPLNDFSEFAGLSYEEQSSMIASGKEYLQEMGIATNIFMAPAHSFDNNTVRALINHGYQYITDGFGQCPYIYNGITYLPISFKKSNELKKDNGYTTFVYHTATMNDKDFADFEKFIINYRQSIIDYSELLSIAPLHKGVLYGAYVTLKALTKRTLVKLKG